MAYSTRTVEVVPVAGYPALRMFWQHHIERADLQPAFQQITAALQQSTCPLYVIVDLSHDPQFPIVDTMMGALRGPFRHPQLAEWLVCGSNSSARMIGSLLTKATRRNNIRWFADEAEALAYLDKIRD